MQLSTGQYRLVATHSRVQAPGQRLTHLSHVPTHKVPGLTLSRDGCRQWEARVGSATLQVVEQLLGHRPEDRLCSPGRGLGLADRFRPLRLEAASAGALCFDEASYPTLKCILEQGLEAQPLAASPALVPATMFVRSAAELLGSLVGGELWN